MHEPMFYREGTPTKYTASCHCKKIRFQFEAPCIYDITPSDCSCSYCTQVGYLNVLVWNEDIVFESGQDEMKIYKFGHKNIKHKFCPDCSTNLFADLNDRPPVPVEGGPIDFTGWLGVNVRIYRSKMVLKLELTSLGSQRRGN